jgi:hypothetical protein
MPQTLKEAIRAAHLKFNLELRDFIVSRPDLSYTVAGEVFGVSYDFVQQVAREFGLTRKTGPKPGWLKKAKEV